MNNKNNTSSTTITGKIRSSLVIKLNVQMLGRLLSGFLAINTLILLMSVSIAFWRIEEQIQDIIEGNNIVSGTFQSTFKTIEKYQILVVAESPKGILIPHGIQRHLPIKVKDVRRSINAPGIHKKIGLPEKIDLVKYNTAFFVNDISYRIEYALGADLRLFLSLISIVLIYEFLIIIGSISKGSRSIRRTLKPLSDMAITAKHLNDEISHMRSLSGDTHIKDLAGVISDIDANKLDRRISVDSSQNELKDLAIAINGMLNRINASYKSQVRFVSDASHELRTPISVIQGYVNLLDRWGKNDEKTMQEAIDAIKGETESMKDLVEQLLFLARGDNETMQLHRQEFDACDIVDEIVYETQMIDPSHTFEIDLNRPAYINADRQLFKQVVRILVDNSIKYTPSGESILIRVATDEEAVRIIVQDNGIGIASEDLPDIFERFYRSDESRARKTGGSGLGLSIAKWIVDRHGGYFEVLSRVDIGTRTTIVLPAAKIPSSKQ